MPELPEVETIASGLSPLVAGKRILEVDLLQESAVRGNSMLFRQRLSSRTVQAVRRRAKLLIMDLEGPMHLVFHLKMTGKVWVPESSYSPGRHTRMILALEREKFIFFEDQRKFGYVAAMTPDELAAWSFYASLGPEPLEVSLARFSEIFSNKKARIKSLLLDQKTIAGIGNIYADEALHKASIHPCTPASALSAKQLGRLLDSLQEVLKAAIHAGGSSFRNYRNALGVAGLFQENFQVYGKKGQPCPVCRTCILTARVAGRTSSYCPHCQKQTG